MSFVTWICNVIDDINDWVGRIVSYVVLVVFVLLLMEAVRRYVFNSPTVWASELVQMLFGAYGILIGGYVLRWESHVTVDIFSSILPKRTKMVISIVTSLLFFLFTGVLLYFGWSMAWESLTGWEHSTSAWDPPVYPIKMMIPLGALLLFLQGLVKLMRDIVKLAEAEKS